MVIHEKHAVLPIIWISAAYHPSLHSKCSEFGYRTVAIAALHHSLDCGYCLHPIEKTYLERPVNNFICEWRCPLYWADSYEFITYDVKHVSNSTTIIDIHIYEESILIEQLFKFRKRSYNPFVSTCVQVKKIEKSFY